MRLLFSATILCCVIASSSWAACSVSSVQVKDNAGNTPLYTAINDGTNCAGETALVAGGAIVSTSNGLPVTPTSGATLAVTQGTAASLLATVSQGGAPWSQNVTQFGGVNLSTGTGAGGTGIPRVTISNDSSLAANQSVNVAQVNGVTTQVNTGAVGTGSQRVAVGTDTATIAGSAPGAAGTASTNVLTVQGIASMTKLLVTPDANSAINEAQINGTTPLMNNGVSGTGSQRINIASDNSAVSGLGAGATGSAVPANAVQMGGNGSGNLTAPVICDNWTPINNAGSSAALKLVSKASSKQIYICSINLVAAAATNVALVEGTQVTNQCDTSTAGMAGGATAATGWNLAANGGLTFGSGLGAVMRTATVNHDVCLLFSAGNQVSGSLSWTQF